MSKVIEEKKLPPGIYYKESKKLYMWRFTHDHIPYSGYCKSLKEAKKELRHKRTDVEKGIYRKEKDIILNDWFYKWISTYKTDCKRSTLNFYTNTYERYVSPVFGGVQIKKIKSEDVQKFINQINEDFSKTTMLTCNFLLYDCLEQAKKLQYINQNPMDYNTLPKAKKREKIKALSSEQEKKFFDFLRATGTSYYPIFRTLALSGMRIGECLALTWDCVDFEKGEIRIQKTLSYVSKEKMYLDEPKSETSRRTIPMHKGTELYDLLKKERVSQFERRAEAGDLWNPLEGFENLVFATKNGKPHFDTNLRHQLRHFIKLMNEAGIDIPYFTPHGLRHCFATRCLEAGMNPKTLQTLLGHTTFSMTMDLYADVLDNTRREEMLKVSAAL